MDKCIYKVKGNNLEVEMIIHNKSREIIYIYLNSWVLQYVDDKFQNADIMIPSSENYGIWCSFFPSGWTTENNKLKYVHHNPTPPLSILPKILKIPINKRRSIKYRISIGQSNLAKVFDGKSALYCINYLTEEDISKVKICYGKDIDVRIINKSVNLGTISSISEIKSLNLGTIFSLSEINTQISSFFELKFEGKKLYLYSDYPRLTFENFTFRNLITFKKK